MSLEYLTGDLKKQDFEKVARLLKQGAVIGFPTETVYGLGALFSQKKALKRLKEIKKRDVYKSFTLHLADFAQIEQLADLTDELKNSFFHLAKHFMPGPLTVVLPAKTNLFSPDFTVGVRIPNHPLFLKLSRYLKEPFVGTSANLANQLPLLSAEEVFLQFKNQIDLLIDGGRPVFQKASTVIKLSDQGLKILREGAIKKAELEKVLEKKLAFL